jgi:hypothetical protein
MPWVMGRSMAHAILRSVRDDFRLNSGVYAMAFSPPFKTKKPLAGNGKWLPAEYLGLLDQVILS